MEELFIANIIYKKIAKGKNNETAKQMIRIVQAKDKEEAGQKVKDFWKDKMRTYTMLQGELTSMIK